MARYIQTKLADQRAPTDGKVEAFLKAIDFWQKDPQLPAPRPAAAEHRPVIAVLLMTNACNLRCTYCYARAGEHPNLQMTLPLARLAIDAACKNALALGQDFFSLSFHGGGEPTLNWRVLTEAVGYAQRKELPCHFSLSSNGLWTEKQRKFILENFDGISLSFDGIRTVQDSQRPRANSRGSFADVLKTIRALDKAKVKYGIRMTATIPSFQHLPESVAFLCHETDCQTIQVEPCYSSERGEYHDPTDEQANAFVQAFMEAYKIASAAKRTFFYSGARPWVLTHTFCRAPEDALIITPEGNIVTCFETHNRRHPLTKSFTIGRAAADSLQIDRTKVRAFARQQEQRRHACEGCFCFWHCGGDCASRCMSSHDDNKSRCHVNREITRELLAWGIYHGDDRRLPRRI